MNEDPMSGPCITCGYTLDQLDLTNERHKLRLDRDHVEKCFKQATSMLDGKSREIERLTAELESRKGYVAELENAYSEQGRKYRDQVDEARLEAATVRRAYLHEKQRAEQAIQALRDAGEYAIAERIEKQAYQGPATR